MIKETDTPIATIAECLEEDPQFRELQEAVRRGAKVIYLHGLVKESTGHFLVSLSERMKRPVFVVSENEARARELASQMTGLLPEQVEYYPEEPMNYYPVDSVISNAKRARLRVMSRFLKGDRMLVTATPDALLRRLSRPEDFAASFIDLRVGEQIEPTAFLEQLVLMRYERVSTVEHRGQFAVRGGIIDCFPLIGTQAIRLELFDTEIDSIRTFDVETQRSTGTRRDCRIDPVEELQFLPKDARHIRRAMIKDLNAALENPLFGQNASHTREKFERLVTQIDRFLEKETILVDDDLLSGYLSKGRYASLVDYFPEDTLVVFEDISRITDQVTAREKLREEERTDLRERGEILQAHESATYAPHEIQRQLRAFSLLNITQILKRMRLLQPEVLLQVKSIEVEQFDRRWDEFCAMLHHRLSEAYRIILFGGNACEALSARLQDSGIPHRLAETGIAIRSGELVLSPLELPQGFRYPDSKLLVLTNREITGKRRYSSKREMPRTKRDFINYQDLVVGDYVVHEDYGVGQYIGTKNMEVQGVVKDFLQISYRGGDQLYIPTDEMNRISKYIGKDGLAPRLSSMGGADWQRAKARARKAVDAIADELVELYAKRSALRGYVFSKDTPWQAEFEEAFSYEETPSQLRAAQEIKGDMESDRPMDRLLCGDVGYGKTEVALRAAFKAMMDGKQVAFLCPTTILTQQHYSTMLDRFSNFPITADFLSRFKTPQQQKEVIKGLAEGRIDIVVGTHRLLSKDVCFKNLGLLIVDEEQRFGVKDKEKIKRLKENVDVLTLSATPIPRTLQMSLTGIRDMSILEEPPEERYPTTTYVVEYDAGLIRDAIRREQSRQGQIYFIYNRVQGIETMAQMLRELVPDLRIEIAHGRMTTRQLENVMERFVGGEADLLLSTTIIETGMDIPNVNTLIVVHADRMGLSQLYQLKGRVGRSDRRSFAYFTYEANKVITEIAEKRLKAIKDFTEFGSGYKIAMRDLELRGAGNLLGESQSGHIESVGYDLYVRMLEEAVTCAKGGKKETPVNDSKVDIKVDAFIPDTYIEQIVDKIMMYRKIASVDSEETYAQVVEELIDRYGDVPQSVVNILDIVLIKNWATSLGFHRVREADGEVELQYEKFEQFSVEELKKISECYNGPLTFDFQGTPMFKIAAGPNKLRDVKALLKLIKQQKTQEDEE